MTGPPPTFPLSPSPPLSLSTLGGQGAPPPLHLLLYAVTAAVSLPVSAGGGAALRRDSRIFLIFSRRFSSSSVRTVRNLITGSVTRKRRSSSWISAPPPSTVSRI